MSHQTVTPIRHEEPPNLMDYPNPTEVHQPQINQPYRVPSPSAPPAMGVPLPQTIPMQEAGWRPPPQGPQAYGHVMGQYSNEPNNQNTIYHHHHHHHQQLPQAQPQATYAQPAPPPPSYPQNIAQQTFASTYQVPPQYVVMAPYVHQYVEGWRTGLFDCLDDPANALITLCFPCVTFGQVAEIVDEGGTSCATSAMLYSLVAFLIGFPCILSIGYRTKLRNKFNLAESVASDWIVHCLCDVCALCQEYRELQKRGLDPSIGWHGNLARMQNLQQQQQQVVMMVPMNQRMIG